MTVELKPCPFCGSTAIKDDVYQRDGRMVVCRECHASVGEFNPEANAKAITKWNRRSRAVEQGEWIKWDGGDFQPVPGEMLVMVMLRDGSIEGPARTREFAGTDSCWKHRGSDGDIIAYRLSALTDTSGDDEATDDGHMRGYRCTCDFPNQCDDTCARGAVPRPGDDEAKLWYRRRIDEERAAGREQNALTYESCARAEGMLPKSEATARDALQAIADLPTGKNEDVMNGHEDAYRAVEALFSSPPRINCTDEYQRGMRDGVREAIQIASDQAALMADMALDGLPENSRNREAMEAALTRFSDTLHVTLDDLARPQSGDDEAPVAWVIPGNDNGDMLGFISAMAWREGEFTRPLFARPQSAAVRDEAAIRNAALEDAAKVAETGDWYGQFQTVGDERRAQDIASRIRALHSTQEG